MSLAGLVAALAAAEAAAQPHAPEHQVQPGETLWGISRQHLRSALRWPEIQRGNTVPVPERLQPGQLLKLPGAQAALSVGELMGMAWIKRNDSPQQALSLGMALQEGDVLVTDRHAFLSLALADGSRVVMPSSSAVRIALAQGGRVRLDLLQGRLDSHIEKQNSQHFEIRTRNAGLGVRGTQFRVRDEEGVSTAEVLEGAVSVQLRVTGAASVVLQGGQGAPLDGPGALQVRALLPAPRRAEQSSVDRIDATPVAQASGYRLQLARDEWFRKLVHEEQAQTPSFALPATLAAGFYYLRLTAFDADRVEGMAGDDMLYLRAAAAPAIATVHISPDGRVDIRWPEAGRGSHVFELARTPQFHPVIASATVVDAEGMTVEPLAVGGRYYWRIRNAGAEGPAAGEARAAGSFDLLAR